MSFNEELAIELGEGIFGWYASERESGRYGSVCLFKNLDINSTERVIFKRYKGFYQLATITIETRKSHFASGKMIGKRFLKQRPGFKTILGEGELHYPDVCSVGVKPLILIPGLEWLDYESLVSLHSQTVKLFIIPSLRI